MVEKKKEDREDEINRYRGFGYVKRVQRLKVDHIEEYKALTGKIQEGLKIHLEFHYLLNTDVNWIVKLVRDSMLEAIKEQIDDEDYFEKRKRRTILTFNIEQISTEKCIDILLTPGIINPEIIEMLKILGLNITSILIWETTKKLKNKYLKLHGSNLKEGYGEQVTFIRHEDGSTEYIKKDEGDKYRFDFQ
jgi:hypothetical protein